jgi:hypothetical protein
MDLAAFRLGLVCERPPAGLGYPHDGDLDRTIAGDHALSMCGREPGAHQLNHLLNREPVRQQHRRQPQKAADKPGLFAAR